MPTRKYIAELEEQLAPLKSNLINHPVYSSVKTLGDIRIFMEYHVFAVWDFMSLLKSLQQELTCVSPPWRPIGSAETRYLINEIVLGEESDTDNKGKYASHFELYCRAMAEAGASTEGIDTLLCDLGAGISLAKALTNPILPAGAADFVRQTFADIVPGKPHIAAGVFTYGREELIPDMFLSLLKELKKTFPTELATFTYYIERHIEVDGGHHSHLAKQMTEELCGLDEQRWREVIEAAKRALHSRITLWDAITAKIQQGKLL